MKKKIFGGIAVLAIAAVAVWNINLSQNNEGLSDISLANAEALANGENNSTNCATSMSYEFRQELCGSGSNKTSLSITCYSCTAGNFNQCQEGCTVTGFGCNGYVNTNSVTSRSC